MANVTPSDTPAPGVRRRDGRGFIDSFGEGRTCVAAGCTTQLSRYNERNVCATHDDGGRSR